MNNLKQIALGLINYTDTYGQLPCGTFVQPSLTPDERLSWMVAILPFIEQQSLDNRFDKDTGWASEHNEIPAQTTIKGFRCPNQPMEAPSDAWSNTSYVGISGVGADAASLPLEDPNCGVFGYERRITYDDIKDGTSNTLCIVETRWKNGPWAAGGLASIRPLDPEQRPYIGENRPFGMDHRQPFLGSFTFASREDLAQAALLDGSVRKLHSSVNPLTLQALATIDGKEQLDYDF